MLDGQIFFPRTNTMANFVDLVKLCKYERIVVMSIETRRTINVEVIIFLYNFFLPPFRIFRKRGILDMTKFDIC